MTDVLSTVQEISKYARHYDPPMRRWALRVQITEGCWNWTGARWHSGYGKISIGNKFVGVHRYGYERFVGAIPDGLEIDHLCRNRLCVNPAHLEAVTPRINNLRSDGCVSTRNALKTHCAKGHEFTPENTRTYVRRGGPRRACRKCEAAWSRNLQRKQEATHD